MSDAPLPEVELERLRFASPPMPPPEQAREAADPQAATPADGEVLDGAVRPERSGRPAASTRASRPTSQAEQAGRIGMALVGLLSIGIVLARWGLRGRAKTLREPSKAEYEAVALPLGQIVARHVPVDLAPDVVLSLVDLSAAAGGASSYLLSDPVQPLYPAPQAPQPQEEPS